MNSYVSSELEELQQSQAFLQEKTEAFRKSEMDVNAQTAKAKYGMNDVLSEIQTLREDVNDKVGAGLGDLSTAAQRISAGIASELDSFHTQVCDLACHQEPGILLNASSYIPRMRLLVANSRASSMMS